jgi:RNA polymerase sigma-70 factor (ECF subfamily)
MTHLSDINEAREVAQEAYVKLLQLDQPGAVSYLKAYLFRTAANLAIDRLRHQTRTAKVHRLDPFEEWSPAASVERALLAEQEVALVRQAILELKPKYQRAILLHKFKDWSIDQIALDMDLTPRRVRAYIARAVLYCRLRLDGCEPAQAREQMMDVQP